MTTVTSVRDTSWNVLESVTSGKGTSWRCLMLVEDSRIIMWDVYHPNLYESWGVIAL